MMRENMISGFLMS